MKNNSRNKLNKTDFVLIFFALLCILLSIVPYSQYKSLADSLAADGNTERLTPRLVYILRVVLVTFSAVSIGLILWHIFSENGRERFEPRRSGSRICPQPQPLLLLLQVNVAVVPGGADGAH